MKFNLNKLLECTGVSDVVKEDVDLHTISIRGSFPFQSPVRLTATAHNRTGVVTLTCVYEFQLALVCDRCLKSFSKQVTQTTQHIVVRSLNGPDDDENFLLAPNGFVELDELATNDVILELPAKFLCREDCQGLCPICGCDRNTATCSCVIREIDPGLEALNKLFE